jgi:hypothetical protein
MAAMVQPEEPIDPGAQLLHRRRKPKCAQHRQAGRLQQQARAGRLGFYEAFKDGNAVSGVGKECRGRLAGDTTSDDADLEPSNCSQRPPLTTRHWPLT